MSYNHCLLLFSVPNITEELFWLYCWWKECPYHKLWNKNAKWHLGSSATHNYNFQKQIVLASLPSSLQHRNPSENGCDLQQKLTISLSLFWSAQTQNNHLMLSWRWKTLHKKHTKITDKAITNILFVLESKETEFQYVFHSDTYIISY